MKTAITTILVLILIYSLVVFFPTANVPHTLNEAVSEVAKEYLRISVRDRSARIHSEFREQLEEKIAEVLKEHRVDLKKDLEVISSVRSNTVEIKLKYVVLVHWFGQEFSFPNTLDIREQAYKF